MPKKKRPFGQVNPLMYFLQLPEAHKENLICGEFISPADAVLDLKFGTGRLMRLVALSSPAQGQQKKPEIELSDEERKFPYELSELDTEGGLPPNFT